MEQFGNPEKFAPYPPRKAANRRCPREEDFEATQKEIDRSRVRENQMNQICFEAVSKPTDDRCPHRDKRRL
jgi:hypothetical protein